MGDTVDRRKEKEDGCVTLLWCCDIFDIFIRCLALTKTEIAQKQLNRLDSKGNYKCYIE